MKWKYLVVTLLIELVIYIVALVYFKINTLSRIDAIILAVLVLVSHHSGKCLGRLEGYQ